MSVIISDKTNTITTVYLLTRINVDFTTNDRLLYNTCNLHKSHISNTILTLNNYNLLSTIIPIIPISSAIVCNMWRVKCEQGMTIAHSACHSNEKET